MDEKKSIQSRKSIASDALGTNFLSKILIIEDDKCALFCLEAIIGQLGYRVRSAIDGKQGLELGSEGDFDLIITDIQLPYISGIELCQRIRLQENLFQKKPVPIIGLTAYFTEEVEHFCLREGMNKVFPKSIAPHALHKIIKQVIANHPIQPER